jgi:transcriptional regulator with XRE-family HTH domain
MAARRPNKSDSSDALRDRVRYLLEYRWHGNQREMARAIGVSQGLISKVLSGAQSPGRRLLRALEGYPGVNLEWLRKGTGQALPTPEEGSLPVAPGVLPGPPLEYPHLLTGSRHPVANAMSRSSRYWVPIPAGSPLLMTERFQLRFGDMLLLEADRAWTQRADLTHGRLCGVRVGSGLTVEYRLGRIGQRAERLVVDFGPIQAMPAPVINPPGHVDPGPPLPRAGHRHRRVIRNLDHEERKAHERGAQAPVVAVQSANEAQCDLDDVVAVCIYMVRPDPKFL